MHRLRGRIKRYVDGVSLVASASADVDAKYSQTDRHAVVAHVTVDGEMKTISSETTFNADLASFEELSTELLALCERLSERLKAKGVVGDTVTLKLKSAGFRLRTRARHLMIPTQLANVLYETGVQLLARETDGTAFRLIGIGVSGIAATDWIDPVDLIEPQIARRAAAERAIDRVRERFGKDAVIRGKLYDRVRARAARASEKSREQEKPE